jgi:hypothetical protein
VRRPEERERGQQIVVWFDVLGSGLPWTMKIMRAEKTSSVMTRPLG